MDNGLKRLKYGITAILVVYAIAVVGCLYAYSTYAHTYSVSNKKLVQEIDQLNQNIKSQNKKIDQLQDKINSINSNL